ncbi:MAG: response regulator, partial [bacterium]
DAAPPCPADGLRLAGVGEAALGDLTQALADLDAPRSAAPRSEAPAAESAGADLRLVERTAPAISETARSRAAPALIVHVEDHASLRDALRGEVERCSGMRYAAAAEIGEDGHGQEPLLAINLLAKETDPLATVCDQRWGRGEPRAFTYLAAGTRGIIAGMTDFIPHPLAPDECATRLLERPGGTQRLLMVSDKIEVMNEIRAVLNRVRCSTSLALDGRQAFDLVGMVKPDAILIDLTLPRGEGLRLVGRLRADAKTAGIAIIFALGEALDVGRFRADAARVLADCRFAPEDLSGAFSQVLSDWRSGNDELRAAG